MDRIRMSLRVCQIRLRKTFTTPRFYVALLWIAILFHVMTVGIRGFCEQTGVDVTFWMLPFMTRYNGDQIIIVLGALLLFCDAPFLEPNSGGRFCGPGGKAGFGETCCTLWLFPFLHHMLKYDSGTACVSECRVGNRMGEGDQYAGSDECGIYL